MILRTEIDITQKQFNGKMLFYLRPFNLMNLMNLKSYTISIGHSSIE